MNICVLTKNELVNPEKGEIDFKNRKSYLVYF
jgi:hypothetical protein